MIDHVFLDKIDANINMTVPLYLMAAYAYYKEDDPIISDHLFDSTAKRMLENWSSISHQHKERITESDLKAGSFLGEYPSIVPNALSDIRTRYAGI